MIKTNKEERKNNNGDDDDDDACAMRTYNTRFQCISSK